MKLRKLCVANDEIYFQVLTSAPPWRVLHDCVSLGLFVVVFNTPRKDRNFYEIIAKNI